MISANHPFPSLKGRKPRGDCRARLRFCCSPGPPWRGARPFRDRNSRKYATGCDYRLRPVMERHAGPARLWAARVESGWWTGLALRLLCAAFARFPLVRVGREGAPPPSRACRVRPRGAGVRRMQFDAVLVSQLFFSWSATYPALCAASIALLADDSFFISEDTVPRGYEPTHLVWWMPARRVLGKATLCRRSSGNGPGIAYIAAGSEKACH